MVSKYHHFLFFYILPTWQLSTSLKLENFCATLRPFAIFKVSIKLFLCTQQTLRHTHLLCISSLVQDGQSLHLHFCSCQCHSRSIPEGVLVEYGDTSSPATSTSASSPDTDLRLAMELSAQAQAEEERLRKQEEEELERILQLSLTEK